MPKTAKGRRTHKIVYKPTNRPCLFTKQDIEYIDYKDVEALKHYISSSSGKILPRRVTGTTAKFQRKLSKAIKQSREIGFLPFVIQD